MRNWVLKVICENQINRIDDYLQLVDGLEAKTKAAVAYQLTSRKQKLVEKIKKRY